MSVAIIFKLAAVGIITAIVAMLLKQAGKDDVATIVSFVGLAVALVMMLNVIMELYQTISDIFGI